MKPKETPDPIAILKQQLFEAQQKELDEVTKKVEDLQKEHQVTIGLQLDIRKLTDIISFMIANNKPLVSLKFEVWKPEP
jgi:Tfp pilus assembly protein PilN